MELSKFGLGVQDNLKCPNGWSFSGWIATTKQRVNYTIPSGNLLHSYWKWWNNGVEIVDLPINSMVIFHSSVSLPEGTRTFQKLFFNSNPLAATPTGMSGTKCGWPWVSSQKMTTSRWIRFLVKNPCWWMVGEWLGYIYIYICIYIYIIMSFFPPQTWIVMNSSYLTLISHSNFWRRIAIPDRKFFEPWIGWILRICWLLKGPGGPGDLRFKKLLDKNLGWWATGGLLGGPQPWDFGEIFSSVFFVHTNEKCMELGFKFPDSIFIHFQYSIPWWIASDENWLLSRPWVCRYIYEGSGRQDTFFTSRLLDDCLGDGQLLIFRLFQHLNFESSSFSTV